ncbi:MAG TPA: polysaccharide biosynthesis protein [Aldersonia sp.]
MRARPPATSAVAGVGLVTAGALTANVAAYLLHVPASRWLGLAGYSEFASLLSVQLLLAVPALALQTVVAREVARGADPAALRSLQWRCAGIVAVVAVVLIPVVTAVLAVPAASAVSALVAAPVLVVLGGEQGLLQGAQRFAQLAVVLAVTGVAKVVPAVLVLALGGGPAPALFAGAVGIVAATGLAWVLAGRGGQGVATTAGVRAVLAASQVQLALIALTSVDLILARVVLDGDDASRYALAAIATKVAFWLPQAVGVVLYPQMAKPRESARAMRTALVVLVALGAATVGAAALASPLVPVLVGTDYAPVQGVLWVFALCGACLALLQGALLASIADERTWLGAIAWVGLAVEITLILTVVHSIGQLIAVAVGCAAVSAAAAWVAVLRQP